MPKKNADHISRPMNCFLAYRLEKQGEIIARFPEANHRDISKIVAKWWRDLPEEEKQPYRDRARLAKEEHQRRFPDYKFRPQKRTKTRQYTMKKKQDPTLMRMMSEQPSIQVTTTPSPRLSMQSPSPSPILYPSTPETVSSVEETVTKLDYGDTAPEYGYCSHYYNAYHRVLAQQHQQQQQQYYQHQQPPLVSLYNTYLHPNTAALMNNVQSRAFPVKGPYRFENPFLPPGHEEQDTSAQYITPAMLSLDNGHAQNCLGFPFFHY